MSTRAPPTPTPCRPSSPRSTTPTRTTTRTAWTHSAAGCSGGSPTWRPSTIGERESGREGREGGREHTHTNTVHTQTHTFVCSSALQVGHQVLQVGGGGAAQAVRGGGHGARRQRQVRAGAQVEGAGGGRGGGRWRTRRCARCWSCTAGPCKGRRVGGSGAAAALIHNIHHAPLSASPPPSLLYPPPRAPWCRFWDWMRFRTEAGADVLNGACRTVQAAGLQCFHHFPEVRRGGEVGRGVAGQGAGGFHGADTRRHRPLGMAKEGLKRERHATCGVGRPMRCAALWQSGTRCTQIM